MEFITPLVALVLGSALTYSVQHHLARREREYPTYCRLAEALSDTEFVLSAVHPERYVWGGPDDWFGAWEEALEKHRQARRELHVVSHLTPASVADSIQNLIPAVSIAADETGQMLSLMTRHEDFKDTRVLAIESNETARALYVHACDVLRRDLYRSALRLPSHGSRSKVWPGPTSVASNARSDDSRVQAQ